MRDIPTGPFTWEQAQRMGLTKHNLRSSKYQHVFRTVWAPADAPDDRDFRLAAVRLILPKLAVVWGLTAAWLYGLDVRREDDLDIHVSFPAGKRIRRRPGLRVSEESLAPTDIHDMNGLQLTTPVRTTFDCLRLERGSNRLVVADAMMHAGLVTVPDLAAYFASKTRLRNLRIAEQLIADIEPLSESPMETRTRLVLTNAGLPRPVAQFEVRNSRGVFAGRVDLAYPELKIAIEYDGAWHWKQRREDDRRRAKISAVGWVVHVLSADYI